MSRSIYSFRPLISRSGDQPGEDLAASTLGFRPVPEQDPEHATLLLGTPHFGESGKNHRPFFRKGFADTRYCPMLTKFLNKADGCILVGLGVVQFLRRH